MKFIALIVFAASFLLCMAQPINAEPNYVYSRNAFISAENGELTIPKGRAWNIPALPRTLNCPVASSCPAIFIDGQFKVGDNGKLNTDHAEISAEQLNNKPLWIFSGSKVKIGISNAMVLVREYSASFDDDGTTASDQDKPAMPIQVTYRKAMLNDTYVATFTNQSRHLLAIMVTARNASFRREQLFRLDVPPNQSKEIGHLEGWAFASGDLITVTHAEYAPIITKIP